MTDVVSESKAIRLKGRSFLALVLTPELPFEDWLARLDDLAARSAGFFLRRPIVLDVQNLDVDRAQLRTMIDQLTARNVRIMGLENARASMLAPDLPPALTDGRAASDFEPPAQSASGETSQTSQPQPAYEREPSHNHFATAMPSLTVTEPVRSGQSLVFPDGDVTVVGSVASGAEIIAGGSIHIYGALRGRALAGTMGNASARIFCRKLEAELIAIDGFYKTAEDMESELRGQAVQIWLEGEAIVAETLS
ncbi:septum site-determining protein MinC [Tianweitania populi]|uniref:Probable septum site-determining protein MinC n=1 Tax=Tianweitania populi TaxID=1607949 RepID=A0A8J3DSV0_9HYPH|nr:septum site-determining protein MinC [Tianweitania populi]GHD22863.1 putative septum site-determining protein MinC [Tianweitania populi]